MQTNKIEDNGGREEDSPVSAYAADKRAADEAARVTVNGSYHPS
jgi:hypothetical protein